MGDQAKALELCREAISSTQEEPFWKFYLIQAQLIEHLTGNIEEVRAAYDQAISACGRSCETVWTESAKYEAERADAVTRARTVLQKARIKLPQSQDVWLHSVRLELQSGNDKIAHHLLSRAL